MSIIATTEEFRPPFLSPRNRLRALRNVTDRKLTVLIFADLPNEIAGKQEAILKRQRDLMCQSDIAVLTIRDNIVTPLCGASGGGDARELRVGFGVNDIRSFALMLIGPDGETLLSSATPLEAEDILTAVRSV
ncbi:MULTISPECIES: hypothetical protein [unclassified Sinorhizobium]|uniref:hypothetical protein n=1 Tax=unclassified Sinorhizobium TaxID=2613772 RepID=UPI00352537BE